MTSVEVSASLAVRLMRPVKVPMVMQTKETVAYRFGGARLAKGVFRWTPRPTIPIPIPIPRVLCSPLCSTTDYPNA